MLNIRFDKYIAIVIFILVLLAVNYGCNTPSTPASTSPPPPTQSITPPTPTPPPVPPTPTIIPSAKITSAIGDVQIKRASATTWIKAESGMTLEIGDSIKTSKSSTCAILYFEGSITELNENTEIRISELSVNRDTRATTVKIKQEIGKTKNRVEKLIDPASQYQVDTPNGAAIARGSISEIQVYKNGTTTILNIEGNWYVLVGTQLIPIPQSTVMWLFEGGFTPADSGSGLLGGGGGDGSGQENGGYDTPQ